MAKNTTPAPPPTMPPLPPTAHHTELGPQFVQSPAPAPQTAAPAVVAEPVPLVDVSGVQMEAHPVGTAQYIAELEVENAQALKDHEATKGRAFERFKDIATDAITHAVAMAGHVPQDISLIPNIDAINAAAAAPR